MSFTYCHTSINCLTVPDYHFNDLVTFSFFYTTFDVMFSSFFVWYEFTVLPVVGLSEPHLYGLMYPRQLSPQVTLAEVTFSSFLCKIQAGNRLHKDGEPVPGGGGEGGRQLSWASCLASAGRVTLGGGTTFGSPNRDNSRRGECHTIPRFSISSRNLYPRTESNSAKPTVIDWPWETQRKRDICTFDNSMKVINNHAGSTLTRPIGNTFSHMKN